MSLFQCQYCGCCENTAKGLSRVYGRIFDWKGMEERKDMKLCSACAPPYYVGGAATGFGAWHQRFPRRFLPKGMFRTARNGNLEHKENGDQDYKKYEITPPGHD